MSVRVGLLLMRYCLQSHDSNKGVSEGGRGQGTAKSEQTFYPLPPVLSIMLPILVFHLPGSLPVPTLLPSVLQKAGIAPRYQLTTKQESIVFSPGFLLLSFLFLIPRSHRPAALLPAQTAATRRGREIAAPDQYSPSATA